MRKSLAAVAAALTCVLAGCAVDGTPTRGPVQLLTGKYENMRSEALAPATTETSWGKERGIRLAEYMLFTRDLDPILDNGALPTMPIAVPRNSGAVVPGSADLPVMKDFEYGFTVTSGNAEDSDIGINHAVYVFSSPAAASAAVKQFTDLMLEPTEYSHYRTATIAGAPDGMSVIQDEYRGKHTSVGITASGDKMVYTWANRSDRAWTERMVKAAYDGQKALLDGMKPISDDRTRDPGKLLTGTIRQEEDMGDPLRNAVYGQRATALFHPDESKAYEALKKFSIEHFAWNGSKAFQADTHQHALGWMAFLADEAMKESMRKAPAPQDLADSRCIVGDSGAVCFATVGKYVGVAESSKLADAQKQVSAQSVFLTKLDQGE